MVFADTDTVFRFVPISCTPAIPEHAPHTETPPEVVKHCPLVPGETPFDGTEPALPVTAPIIGLMKFHVPVSVGFPDHDPLIEPLVNVTVLLKVFVPVQVLLLGRREPPPPEIESQGEQAGNPLHACIVLSDRLKYVLPVRGCDISESAYAAAPAGGFAMLT
jgi:hypothetical protein